MSVLPSSSKVVRCPPLKEGVVYYGISPHFQHWQVDTKKFTVNGCLIKLMTHLLYIARSSCFFSQSSLDTQSKRTWEDLYSTSPRGKQEVSLLKQSNILNACYKVLTSCWTWESKICDYEPKWEFSGFSFYIISLTCRIWKNWVKQNFKNIIFRRNRGFVAFTLVKAPWHILPTLTFPF